METEKTETSESVGPQFPDDIPISDILSKSDASIQRNIFGLSFEDPRMHYTEYELQKVADLDATWGPDGDPLIGTGIEETQKLRFVQGSFWDIHRAHEAVLRYVRWRKENRRPSDVPPNPRDPHTWLYFYGKDKQSRPILVIDCRRLLEKKAEAHSLTFVQDTLVDAMNYFVSHLSVPGRVEQVLVIANLDGCSMWSTPMEEIEDCVHALSSCFRARLNRLLVLNTPLVFYAFWKVARVFIPERTLAKIAIFRGDFHDELYRWIDHDEIDPLFRRDPSSSPKSPKKQQYSLPQAT